MTPAADAAGDVPARLPVTVRPRPGEGTDSYVRRLARANHLRPSALHGYLCGPPFWFGKPRIERLAAVSGRPRTVLARALTDCRVPRRRDNLRLSPAPMQPDTFRLYQRIRADAEDHGRSLAALAIRHGVGRCAVRTALTTPLPPPRERPRTIPVATIPGPLMALIDQRIKLGESAREIWIHLMDEAAISVSYSTVRLRLRQHQIARR
ncbi:hypothetical protein [Streptomyces sp. NBC_01643]|uniref:hypothetical protein n=1 Tax=Streptomyces sp. NBC_01643 TaxID=2975906 RepID=UPI002F9111AD|nr:hypothetical protein OHB03_49425 [Streptomyces sp. NBC_01643]